ncbi:hypothetical protein EL22_28650 [Halostagnicola sp. A56]|nr:hypothetical protein EL22_28650 [Halostagnicola sp. A56]
MFHLTLDFWENLIAPGPAATRLFANATVVCLNSFEILVYYLEYFAEFLRRCDLGLQTRFCLRGVSDLIQICSIRFVKSCR